jgi:opacity protein-like surface antigen
MKDRILRMAFSLFLSFLSPGLLHAASISSSDSQTLYFVAGNVGILQGNINATYSDFTDVIAQSISESYSQQSYTGGVGLGVTKIYAHQYLIGGEVSANFNTGNGARYQAGANSTAFMDTTFIKNNINLTLQPGLMLATDVASYLNLGVSFAQISDQINSPLNSTPVYQSVNQQNWQTGAVLGAGLRKYLTTKWSVFLEYNYYDYGNISFANFQNYEADYSHKSHITSNVLTVGAVWNL